MRCGLLSVLLLGPVAACSDASPRSPVVERGAWGDSVVLVEVLRLGKLDGAPYETFGYVQAVVPSGDGGLFVADRVGPIVRHYGRNGAYVGDIGRTGGGPGEYMSVDGLGTTASGELIVIDSRLARVSIYSPEGEFQRSVQTERVVASDRGYAVGEDGTVYARATKASGAEPVRDDRGLIDWASVFDWATVTLDGTVQPIGPVPLEQAEGPGYVIDGRGGPYWPFVTRTASTIGPDGSTYWVRNDEYQVFQRRPGGDTTVIERVGEQAVPLAGAELAEWNARSYWNVERNPRHRDRYLPIPAVKPLIRELAVDLDGRLWVSRYTQAVRVAHSERERAYRESEGLPSHEWRDAPTWDVFDTDGAFLGSVTLPMNTAFMTAKGKMVWGVQAGDQREDYVVQWRVDPYSGS